MNTFQNKTKIFLSLILLIFAEISIAASITKEKNQQKSSISTSIIQNVVDFEKTRVIERANQMLNVKPKTVTATSSPRSAGGKHDFFSEGPYWWPDPAKPEGPYIQHDGLRNPDRFENHDNDLRDFAWIVGTETSAYLLTGDKKYAEASMNQMHAWFVDTTTLMNPNFLYAQAIHGICTGRGIGIIDAVSLMDVARSVMILEKSSAVSKKEIEPVKAWFRQFTTWLTTHPYGIDEMNAKNNHGTWWHAQVATYAALIGDQKILKDCREWYTNVLLTKQMATDGSFPLELKRTKPYSYSLFNLDATAALVWTLSDKSPEIWKSSLPDGRGMHKGLDFILPYLQDKTKWPYQKDVAHWEEQPDARQFMLFAALAEGNPDWMTMWKTLGEKNSSDQARIALPIKNPLLWIGLNINNLPNK